MGETTRRVVVALSQELWTVHQAYIKSLQGARVEIVTADDVDEYLSLAQRDPALLVVGTATGFPATSGQELVRRLAALSPRPEAPVLLLQDPRTPRTPPPASPLRLIEKWSLAREALGLVKAASHKKTQRSAPPVAPVRVRSSKRTLEIMVPRPPGPDVDRKGTGRVAEAGDGAEPGASLLGAEVVEDRGSQAKARPAFPGDVEAADRAMRAMGLTPSSELGDDTLPRSQDSGPPAAEDAGRDIGQPTGLATDVEPTGESSGPSSEDRTVELDLPEMGLMDLDATEQIALPPPDARPGGSEALTGREGCTDDSLTLEGAFLADEDPTPLRQGATPGAMVLSGEGDDSVSGDSGPIGGVESSGEVADDSELALADSTAEKDASEESTTPRPDAEVEVEAPRSLEARPVEPGGGAVSGSDSEQAVAPNKATAGGGGARPLPSGASSSAMSPPSRTEELLRYTFRQRHLILLLSIALVISIATTVVLVVYLNQEEDDVVTNGADAGAGGEAFEPPPPRPPSKTSPDAGSIERLPEELVLPLDYKRHRAQPYRVDWRRMQSIIDWMKAHPATKFVLVGHASPDELPRKARRLAYQRARLARDMICLKGPSRERFTIRSAGASEPVEEAEGRSVNEASRRVVLHLIRR